MNKRLHIFDLGNKFLKYLCCDNHSNQLQIIDFKVLELPADAKTSGTTPFQQPLQQLMTSLQIEPKEEVSVILPRNTVFTRYFTLPDIPKSKMNKIIRFEAEQQIPFMLKEVSWGYCILSSPSEKAIHVFLSAIKNQEIDKISDTFQTSSLRIKNYATTPLAYYNAMQNMNTPSQFGLIDIGHEITSILFCNNGKVWSRNVLFGAERLSNELAASFKLSNEKLFQLFQKIDLENMPDNSKASLFIKEKCTAFLENISNEIRRTFTFYKSNETQFDLQKLYVTGGVAGINGFDKALQSIIGFETEKLNLFTQFSAPSHLQNHLTLHQHKAQAALAMALSLNAKSAYHIELLPQLERERRELKKTKQKLNFSLGLLFSFLLLFLFNNIFESLAKAHLLNKANKKIETYQQFAQHINQIEDQIKALDLRFKTISEKNRLRFLPQNAFKTISENIPENIWLHELDYSQNGSLTFKGFCQGTLADINSFKTVLEETPAFDKVYIEEATIDESFGKGKETIRRFTMKISLHNNEAN